MDDPNELHAFLIGYFEVLCPWPPRLGSRGRLDPDSILKEYHYYLFGRGMAVIAWILIAKIIQVAFW